MLKRIKIMIRAKVPHKELDKKFCQRSGSFIAVTTTVQYRRVPLLTASRTSDSSNKETVAAAQERSVSFIVGVEMIRSTILTKKAKTIGPTVTSREQIGIFTCPDAPV